MEFSDESRELLRRLLDIEARRVRELASLVADRIDQDPGDLSVDWQTGQLLGALSDAARAARHAVMQRIIQKGGEDPGWGR